MFQISRPVDMDTFYKHYRPVYQIFHIKIQQQHLWNKEELV